MLCSVHSKFAIQSTMADPHSSSPADAQSETGAETEPLFPNLPNDVAVQCLARVPRSHHPSLSLVCKSWLALLRSPLFYSVRRSLLAADFSIYLNIRLPTTPPSFKWFLLLNPNPQIHSISSIPSSQPIGASIVSLNSKIYAIGGSINEIPTSSVWILDSITNKWEPGPQMRVAREFAAAGAVNGRIYVLGGCRVNNRARTVNWAEVFDPETGLWAPVASPDAVKEDLMHASAVVRGKLYAMADRGGMVYNAGGGGEWEEVPKRLDMGWRGRAAAVGGVLYCYDYLGKIKGFDVEGNLWSELKGVEKGLPKFMSGATLADVDGRLFVVWLDKGSVKKQVEVRCAEIAVEKDAEGRLRGSVAWSGVVLVVPDGSIIVNCLAVGF